MLSARWSDADVSRAALCLHTITFSNQEAQAESFPTTHRDQEDGLPNNAASWQPVLDRNLYSVLFAMDEQSGATTEVRIARSSETMTPASLDNALPKALQELRLQESFVDDLCRAAIAFCGQRCDTLHVDVMGHSPGRGHRTGTRYDTCDVLVVVLHGELTAHLLPGSSKGDAATSHLQPGQENGEAWVVARARAGDAVVVPAYWTHTTIATGLTGSLILKLYMHDRGRAAVSSVPTSLRNREGKQTQDVPEGKQTQDVPVLLPAATGRLISAQELHTIAGTTAQPAAYVEPDLARAIQQLQDRVSTLEAENKQLRELGQHSGTGPGPPPCEAVPTVLEGVHMDPSWTKLKVLWSVSRDHLGMTRTRKSTNFLQGRPADIGFGAYITDSDLATNNACTSVLRKPGATIQALACWWHALNHHDKHKLLLGSNRGADAREKHQLVAEAANDLSNFQHCCVIPSSAALFGQLFVQKWIDRGEEPYAKCMESYWGRGPGPTPRAVTNLQYHGGVPSDNNGQESTHRHLHDHLMVRKHGAAHVENVAIAIESRSAVDAVLDDQLRPDVWGADFFRDVRRINEMTWHPGSQQEVRMSTWDCRIATSLMLEVGVKRKVLEPGHNPVVQVCRDNGDLTLQKTSVVLMPSKTTVLELASCRKNVKGKRASALTAQIIRELAQAPCSDGSPSWVKRVEALFEDPSAEQSKWLLDFSAMCKWSSAFAVLVKVSTARVRVSGAVVRVSVCGVGRHRSIGGWMTPPWACMHVAIKNRLRMPKIRSACCNASSGVFRPRPAAWPGRGPPSTGSRRHWQTEYTGKHPPTYTWHSYARGTISYAPGAMSYAPGTHMLVVVVQCHMRRWVPSHMHLVHAMSYAPSYAPGTYMLVVQSHMHMVLICISSWCNVICTWYSYARGAISYAPGTHMLVVQSHMYMILHTYASGHLAHLHMTPRASRSTSMQHVTLQQ